MIKTHKYTLFSQLIIWVLFEILLLTLFVADLYNEKRDYCTKIPYDQIYCYFGTAYKVYDISFNDCVNKLTQLIKNDSTACYGYENTGFGSRIYIKKPVKVFETESYHWGNYAQNPMEYCITLLVPYDRTIRLNGNLLWPADLKEEPYYRYYKSIACQITIIDTDPIILILPRGVDFDEQIIINRLNNYIDTKYLNKICRYDKQEFKNWYFFCVYWAIFNVHYFFGLSVLLFIITFSLERYNKRKKEEDHYFDDIMSQH